MAESRKSASAQPTEPAQRSAGEGVEQQAEPEALKLRVGEWREQAGLTFGVSPHALAGAFHGQDPEDVYTEEEVRSALRTFLDRPAVAEDEDTSS